MCLLKVGLYSQVYKGYGPVLETKGPTTTPVASLVNAKTVKIS
jgi:hypothetical protein